MPTEHPAMGPGTAPSSTSQPAGGDFLNGNSPSNWILHLFNGAWNDPHGYFTDPAPSTGTSEGPIHLLNLPVTNERVPSPPKPAHLPSVRVTDQQVPNNDQDPERKLGQHPQDQDNTFRSQELGRRGDSNRVPCCSKRRTRIMLITVLIVGVLALILVPGLVLGFVARQVPWGIALSGAMATIAGVFGGLYYHLHK